MLQTMDSSGEHDDTDIDQASILKKAISEIKDGASTDDELLSILEKHIVTLQLEGDPINEAVDEIERLAKERAET